MRTGSDTMKKANNMLTMVMIGMVQSLSMKNNDAKHIQNVHRCNPADLAQHLRSQDHTLLLPPLAGAGNAHPPLVPTEGGVGHDCGEGWPGGGGV